MLHPVPALGGTGTCDCAGTRQDSGILLLCIICQAGSLVDRVSDDRVFIAMLGTDVAGEHGANRHPDTEVDKGQQLP